MADEVKMTPIAGAEPPKADPLAKPAATKVATIKLNPLVHKPVVGGAPTSALKPGLKLPPKPGLATSALKPGLKLPTQAALKPGVKLPPKPVIRKPGATVAAAPLPKPLQKPVAPEAKPAAAEAKPVAVDAQGVGKLPTVSATAIARGEGAPDVGALPKPMEALKSVTQKLKGITQEIPQQAILHKTGIIAEGGASEVQKEAAKHKTARISLSDAMGVAPVKNESAPMKTIRIKRPINIPGATASLTPPPKAEASPAVPPAEPQAAADAQAPSPAGAQRKTLKISRPGGLSVRPGGKFGIKRPTPSAPAAAAQPTAASEPAMPAPAEGAVADIPDMPTNVPAFSSPASVAPVAEGPAWLWTLSAVVQAAACVAIGALVWFLYENTQTQYF